MGMKQLPKHSGEYLFEIIMRRYQKRSTMMTSNRPLEDWGKLIGDVPAATAILDRFLHHAEIIQITGKSYRLSKQNGPDKTAEVERRSESDSARSEPSKPATLEGGAHDGNPAITNQGPEVQNRPGAHRLENTSAGFLNTRKGGKKASK